MRAALLGSLFAVLLSYASLSQAQSLSLTGEARLGQVWRDQVFLGTESSEAASDTDVDLDLRLEADGWFLEAEDLDADFAGDVDLVLDSGLFATSDLSDWVDTSPQDLLMENYTSAFIVPNAQSEGGGSNNTILGQFLGGLYFEAGAGGALGFEADALRLAMAASSSVDSNGLLLAAAYAFEQVQVSAQVSEIIASVMLSYSLGDLSAELAAWYYEDSANFAWGKGERTALTLSYSLADAHRFSLAYHPEAEYELERVPTQSSEVAAFKYEGDVGAWGLELGITEWDQPDLWIGNIYNRGGRTLGLVVTYALSDRVELGFSLLDTREYGATPAANLQFGPDIENTIVDLGLSVSF